MTVQAVHGGLTRRVPGFDVYVTVAAGSVVGDRPIVKSAPLETLDAGADGLELVADASLVGLAAAVDPAAGRLAIVSSLLAVKRPRVKSLMSRNRQKRTFATARPTPLQCDGFGGLGSMTVDQ
ncbi:hypothetical protein ACWFPY_06470 [Nocardia fluminea]